jgi:hypothetical protein
MIVLIPHPSECLLLSKTQKTVLASLNKKGIFWYPCFPLWVELDENDTVSDAADFRRTVLSLTLYAPQINGTMFFFPAELKLKNGSILKGKIGAGKKSGMNPAGKDNSPTDETALQTDFPHVCRIFRAAEAQFTSISKNGCEWKVMQSFWIKNR